MFVHFVNLETVLLHSNANVVCSHMNVSSIQITTQIHAMHTTFQTRIGYRQALMCRIPVFPAQFGNEAQQMEWAKRESERAERERLKRLRQQEQDDLELAIALSKAEMSNP